MSDLKQYYAPTTSSGIKLIILAITLLCLGLVGLAVISILKGPIFTLSDSLSQQGSFFGGYLTAIVGLLTIAAVVLIGYRQQQEQQRYFMRQYFLHGLELISSAMQNTDEVQALRIIDYFSRLAMSSDDDELFLVLNTIFSGNIRKQLESPEEYTRNNYPFAVETVSRIGEIQKAKALMRKGITR